MSWHTSAILIKADFSKQHMKLFKTLDLNGAEVGDMISFEEATATDNEGVAIGTVDGWTALWGNTALYMVDDEGLASIAKKATIFQMTLEGTSSTAGFSWWTGGTRIRDWMRQDGKVIKNEGKPLPEENAAFTKRDDEQAVLQILCKLTVPFERLEAIEYQLYGFDEEALFGDE
jgi:hypothetical protein